MSRSVDERVVQMKFDNAQFEKNTAQSMKTMSKLKDSLNDLGKSKTDPFKEISKSANGIDFSKLESNIQALSDRFSTMGIVGMTVIQDITNSMLGVVKNTWNKTIGQMKSGGMARALNIQQARFQMEGLLKDEEKVDAVMEKALASVDGTAYSLDAAAKVASTLTASGLTDLDKLERALRGVAGAAAMSGKDYQSVGDIFSTVASNGRLMTMQLRQFSSAGLNISATLAEQLGKTEAQINEMVTKGKISFDEFAEAMANAYAEHATKANDTYEGALSNMKSAMNKIGADFMTPYLDAMRPIFLAIKDMFNRIKVFTSVFANGPWTKTLERLSKIIQEIIGSLNFSFLGRIADFLEGPLLKTPQVLYTIWNFMQGIGSIASKLGRAVFDPIGRAFKLVFNKDYVDILHGLSMRFKIFADNLKFSGPLFNNIGVTFTGLFTALKLVGNFMVDLIKDTKPLWVLLGELINRFFELTANLSRWFINLTKTKDIHAELTSIFQRLADAIRKVVDWIAKMTSSMVTLGKTIATHINFQPLVDGIKSMIDSIKKYFTLGNITESLKTVGNALVEVIYNIIDRIGKLFSDNKFMKGFKRFVTIFSAANTTRGIAGFVQWIRALFDEVKVMPIKLQNFAKSIQGVFESASGALDAVSDTLEHMQNAVKAKAIKSIAVAVALLAFSLIALSSLDIQELGIGLLGIAGILGLITGAFSILAKTLKNANPKAMVATGKAMTSMGVAVALMAVAVHMLADLNLEQLVIGLAGVVALIVALSGASIVLSKHAKNLNRVSKAFIPLAAGILILSAAVKVLAQLNLEQLAKGVGGVAVLLAALAGFSHIFKKSSIGVFSGMGMVLMATSLVIFVQAMKPLAYMPINPLVQGITAIGVILGIIAAFSQLIRGGRILAAAVALPIIGAAISIFVKNIKDLGGMSLLEMQQGLTGMAAGLLELAVAMYLMQGLLKGAAALLIASIAIGAIAKVVALFGGLEWDVIVKGLIALGGALLIVVAAGALASLCIGGLLALSATLIAISVTIVVAAAGFALFAAAISAMAISISMGATLITNAITNFLTIVKAIVKVFGDILTALINLAAPLAKAVAKLIEAFANVLPEVIEKVALAIVQGIQKIIIILIENGSQIAMGILVLIAGLLQVIAENIPVIVNAGVELITHFIDAMANAIVVNSDKILTAINNLINSILYFALSAIQTILQEIPLIGDKLGGALETAKQSVKDKMSTDEMANIGSEGAKKLASKSGDFESSGSTLGGAFTKGLTESTDETALGGVGEKLLGSLDGLTGDFNTKGIEAMTGWGEGADSKTDSAAKSVDKVNDKALDKMKLARKKYVTEGGTGVKKIGEGMRDSKAVGEVRKAGENAGGKGAEGAKSKRKDFVSAGKDAASGYVEGINSKQSAVYSSGGNMAKWALMGTKERQKSNSPSKEFAKLGEDGGEGYVGGVLSTLSDIRKATSKMAGSALDGMQSAIGRINDLIGQGDNFTPVIRPVVDLSGVAAGASQISGYFNSPTVSPYTDQVNAIVNGGVLGVTGQLNVASVKGNREVVDSIAEIRADIYDLNNAIRNMQLVLDTGATVGGIYQKMDAKLGQVQGYKGRNI